MVQSGVVTSEGAGAIELDVAEELVAELTIEDLA